MFNLCPTQPYGKSAHSARACRRQADEALANESKLHIATRAGLVAQQKAYAQLGGRTRREIMAAMQGALFGYPMSWSTLKGELPPRCGHGAATLTFGEEQVRALLATWFCFCFLFFFFPFPPSSSTRKIPFLVLLCIL